MAEQFAALVAECQTHIQEIQAKTAGVQQNHAEQDRVAELETIMDSINENSCKFKDNLQLLRNGINKLKATPQDEAANSAVIKIQQDQHALLVRTFTQAVKDYQDIQNKSKRSYEAQTARRIQTKCEKADGSTIDEAEATRLAREALESGDADAILLKSNAMLAQILETRQTIFMIERSMRELNQLVYDVAAAGV